MLEKLKRLARQDRDLVGTVRKPAYRVARPSADSDAFHAYVLAIETENRRLKHLLRRNGIEY